MTGMFRTNFLYKIQTECWYEKCPRTRFFAPKKWSNYDYVEHAKIKKHPGSLCPQIFRKYTLASTGVELTQIIKLGRINSNLDFSTLHNGIWIPNLII